MSTPPQLTPYGLKSILKHPVPICRRSRNFVSYKSIYSSL